MIGLRKDALKFVTVHGTTGGPLKLKLWIEIEHEEGHIEGEVVPQRGSNAAL